MRGSRRVLTGIVAVAALTAGVGVAADLPPERPLRSSTVSGASQPAAPPGDFDIDIDGDLSIGGALYRNNTRLLHTPGPNSLGLGPFALHALTTGPSNIAIGAEALYATTDGEGNTAVGVFAGWQNVSGDRNTALGAYALRSNQYADFNTAVGYRALHANVGYDAGFFVVGRNVAVGNFALGSSTTGHYNTALGSGALSNVGSGSSNVAVGYAAGMDQLGTDSSNILINSRGNAGDDHTLRIGQGTGVESQELTAAYIHGIFGRSLDDATDVPVLIDGDGKLGTMTSSRRYKEDIRDLGDRSDQLLALRPVSFRYRHANSSPGAPRYGLIAEEVATVLPELVVLDAEGRPETVKYHLLSSLLLNEMQRQHRRLEAQDRQLRELRERLAALEGS